MKRTRPLTYDELRALPPAVQPGLDSVQLSAMRAEDASVAL